MSEENQENTIDVFESKVSDSEFVCSESIRCEHIKVEMTTLCELVAPNLKTQALSITYPALDEPLTLNSELLNLLPKFHGLPREDPYRHINEFIITCSTMQPEASPRGQITLRAFPFSFLDKAKDWLLFVPCDIHYMTQVHKAFLEKFFSNI